MKKHTAFVFILCISGFFAEEVNARSDLEQRILHMHCALSYSSISAKIYTSENKDGYELETNFVSTNNFDKIKKNSETKIIIPGWQFLGASHWPLEFVKEYLSLNSSLNVILMHWEESESFRPALESECISETGFWIARFLDFLRNQGFLEYERTHLLGHSFGAHVAGNTGRNINGTIARITALDPGIDVEAHVRLKKSDAIFVDVIHTSQLGNVLVRGHIDFYPNGGRIQDNCDIFTSHSLAVRYMLESIGSPRAFPAVKCGCYIAYNMNDCKNKEIAYMGEHVNRKQSGQFFLKTKEKNNKFGMYKIFRKIPPETQRQLYINNKKLMLEKLNFSESKLCLAVSAFVDKTRTFELVRSVTSSIMKSIFHKIF